MWNSKPISLSQTRLEGDGEDCHLQSDWPTVCPDCNTDLYIWSTRTVPEGRGYCMYEQRGTVPLLTQLAVLHWSYMMTTNKSSSSVIICSVILSQGDLMNEYFFDVFKHIPGLPRPRCCVLYFPTNADTVSQPLNAWENDNAFDPGPNDLTISWIGIHRKSSPFPNVVHNLSIFKWSSKKNHTYKNICIQTHFVVWSFSYYSGTDRQGSDFFILYIYILSKELHLVIPFFIFCSLYTTVWLTNLQVHCALWSVYYGM